jgi:hypothetical protein
MSQFVDYNKRNLTLPPGCKDLIDVLRSPSSSDVQGLTVSDGGVLAGRLTEIEKYVAMVFVSRARVFSLTIKPPGEPLAVDFVRTDDGRIWGCVVVKKGSGREIAMQSFIKRRGLPTPEDAGTIGQFQAGLLVVLVDRISPLPAEVADLARLVSDLFRNVCGLADDSKLSFQHYEITGAA